MVEDAEHDFLAVAAGAGPHGGFDQAVHAGGARFDVHFSTPFWDRYNPMCTPSSVAAGACRFGGELLLGNVFMPDEQASSPPLRRRRWRSSRRGSARCRPGRSADLNPVLRWDRILLDAIRATEDAADHRRPGPGRHPHLHVRRLGGLRPGGRGNPPRRDAAPAG